jgi:hypothetical protein
LYKPPVGKGHPVLNVSTKNLKTGAICLCLIVTSSLVAENAEARHKQQVIDASNGIPGSAPSANGTDKFHAPPVPSDWGFPDLNVRVANFGVQHLSEKIGNGECWTLAEKALEFAGAQPATGYVFGRLLPQNDTWLPGDIIQFTKCEFVDIEPNRRSTITVGTPNHTAIIYSIKDGLVTVLQQNVNGDKHVQTGVLNFSKMVSGSLQVYRPVPSNGQRPPGSGLKVRYSPF